jgi:antitoxin PrlF
MASATITSKGQTTIPKAVRQHLKLKVGDRVEFVIERDGRVVLVPASLDIGALNGVLAPAPRRVTLEEMDEAIRDQATGKRAKR